MKKVLFLFALILSGFILYNKYSPHQTNLKLYWFIPDGVRAEPFLFNMFEWAKEGKLPNIKHLIDNGSFGYSYPNFPSHTPTNFAALLTGSYPEINGVDDGPMRAIGKPLDKVAVPGFRSTARKVPAIWSTLEQAGMKVAIVSVPGSTPPEIQKGVVIRGRWGGWGADFAALNYETKGDLAQRIRQGRASRFFYFGPELTQYDDGVEPTGWTSPPTSYSPPKEVILDAWGTPVYLYIYDTTNDQTANYDKIGFSLDKKTLFASLTTGEWGNWSPITLKWVAGDQKTDVATNVKPAVIKIDKDGFFRVRLYFDQLNRNITMPAEASDILEKTVGPMVDFPDNFPAQLIYYPEDKKIFQDEASMSFDWHTKAVYEVIRNFSPDVVIHDIYTPNQMLTSRWWMGYVDPKSTRYNDMSASDRDKLWQEVKGMYKRLDDLVGEVIKNAGSNTYIVFSSDHGNVPLNKYVNLNNLFAQNGWLKFTMNPTTGEPIIDWGHSQVIYLKMAHVYINPNGLSGDYKRASGPAYENLRNEVIKTLTDLTDTDGTKPVVDIVKWENAKTFLQMDPDRAGDLIIANSPGYGWNEEMSTDLMLFTIPLVTGYKQAIIAKDDPGMWTPFIISGPGIKKNNYLGDKPFSLVNQYPTIMKALQVAIPGFVQGKSLPVFSDGR